jgi:Zn-dependent protease
MRQTVTLGRLFDIRVGVHVSWFVVYVFMTISIAGTISGVAPPLAFGLAATCALLLFVSVIAHEFAHALVARRFGVRTRAITLFLFGGVATLECEPPSPRAEVTIALAGPVMSAIIAAVVYGLFAALERWATGPIGAAIGIVAAYLALANAVLALFNVIPAFPMDGGRVLRAAVWHARKSRAAATGAASIVGLVVALTLVVSGGVAALGQRRWQDGWYVLIGAFLLRQAWVQLRDSRLVERLERVRVSDMMEAAQTCDAPFDGFSLASSASALEAVSAFRSSTRAQIPVIDAGELAGWLRRERTLAFLDRAA